MVLVDTSIWVSHFRVGNAHLRQLLHDEDVVCHPFVIGELACGYLDKRKEIIFLLKALPPSRTVDDGEVLQFIELNRLMGAGIGLVDVHLLASALLTNAALWTADKPLRKVSGKFGVLYE